MADVGERGEGDSLLATSRGGLVSARGTSDGVVLRLDGRVPDQSLKLALTEFMEPRKTFLGGQEVSLEWIGVRPGTPLVGEVTQLLVDNFGITVRTSKVRDVGIANVAQLQGRGNIREESVREGSQPAKTKSDPIVSDSDHNDDHHDSGDDDDSMRDLFAGIDDFDPEDVSKEDSKTATKRISLADPTLWDDPDARIINSTLRSGQRIESEHSLIIIGDVNPGAEIVAGGEVVVLGSLRGVAHAGAYDETGGGRTIFALSLQPTQLRIGTTISRGSADGGSVPEIARVEGNMIVVEPFAKKVGSKRR